MTNLTIVEEFRNWWRKFVLKMIIKTKAPGTSHAAVFPHITNEYILSWYSGTPSWFRSGYRWWCAVTQFMIIGRMPSWPICDPSFFFIDETNYGLENIDENDKEYLLLITCHYGQSVICLLDKWNKENIAQLIEKKTQLMDVYLRTQTNRGTCNHC